MQDKGRSRYEPKGNSAPPRRRIRHSKTLNAIAFSGVIATACAPTTAQQAITKPHGELCSRPMSQLTSQQWDNCIDQYAKERPAAATSADVSDPNLLAYSTPRVMGRTDVALQASPGGSYYLPVTINHILSVPFLLDTGAEGVQIPLDVYLVLMRKGSLSPSDGLGSVTIVNADGSSRRAPLFVIHEIKVGDRVITNIAEAPSQPRQFGVRSALRAAG